MRAKKFLNQLRHNELVAAIRDAERLTSGEIRVFISRKEIVDPVAAAQEQFVKLEMEKTRERNGVLIFLAPLTCKFAVVGDSGIHAKCGDAFWNEVANAMASHFRRSEFTRGIQLGIARAGELLSKYFPRNAGDHNELSDDIATD
ncbi:MAG TPA: TPM domain-containing protein [Verrucomicrobiae bacterium]|nr:TPM domain-containing protein [Verrucomicrobiae bacterium]